MCVCVCVCVAVVVVVVVVVVAVVGLVVFVVASRFCLFQKIDLFHCQHPPPLPYLQ